MRSLKNGCTERRGGFHQKPRCTYACALADTLVQKTFESSYFPRQLLLWRRKSVIQSRRSIGWRGAREGRAGGLCWRDTEGYGEGARHKDNYIAA